MRRQMLDRRDRKTLTTESKTMNPTLSILTPTIPGRESQVKNLESEIAKQAGNLPVEHLVLSDNRKRSIGKKRQALLDIARGEYVAFCDDDDYIKPGYVASILEAAKQSPDVITFQQASSYNGLKSRVIFKLGQGDFKYNPMGDTLRDAWHVCAWRRDLVKNCLFGDSNYGEDAVWCHQARHLARTTVHIDKILHAYIHDAATTAAPE